MLRLFIVVIVYDNAKTNTGHGGRGLDISVVANSRAGPATAKHFSRHAHLNMTTNYY